MEAGGISMWNDIRDEKTLEEFMESMDFFMTVV